MGYKNRVFKGTAGALAIVITMGNTLPVMAEIKGKEEVIYAMTDASGDVSDVEVVNIFSGGSVNDFGDYSTVKMLNTTDTIIQVGDKVSFTSVADKVYYQGTLNDNNLPWNIKISYILDGKRISAADLAGKSGALKIHFMITKNDNYSGDFYENYALQAAFALDTEKCRNIVSGSGTFANVGQDKQISFTILPGKGIDTEISADVTDFEMEAATINGVRLNLNVEIDDADLMSQVRELMDGAARLNDGALAVNEGAGSLKSGTKSINDGAVALTDGASSLDAGINTLQSGIAAMQAGLNTLNSKSKDLTDGSSQMLAGLKTLETSLDSVAIDSSQLEMLTESSSAIKQGISELKSGIDSLQSNLGYQQYCALMYANGLDMNELYAGNTAAIAAIGTQITGLQESLEKIATVPGYEAQAAQLTAQIEQLSQILKLLTGNNGAIVGTKQYLDGLSEAVTKLQAGASELNNKYTEFDAAIGGLADKLSGLLVNMSDLKNGVSMLVDNYSALNAGVSGYTEGVATIVYSYSQMVSGASALASGSENLLVGSRTLSDGTSKLLDGVSTLSDGTQELSNGTSELNSKTSGMDTQVQEKIDGIMESIKGNDEAVVSFVSSKNTDVQSVQFVIKTDAVKKTEIVETETVETESLNFWQKLLRLFGIK